MLVLEAGDRAGGLAARREFHPGFFASPAHSISHFSEKVTHDLDLPKYGFAPGDFDVLPNVALGTDGQHVTIGADLDGVAEADSATFREYSRLLNKCASALEPFWLKTMPRIGASGMRGAMTFAHLGLNLRRLGKADMREFLRIASLPARDLVDEFFENDLLKAALCWDSLIGGKMAPRSPNGPMLVELYRRNGESGGKHVVPPGGVGGLIDALAKSAVAAGAEIRYEATVSRIQMIGDENGLRAGGVVLRDGTVLESDLVVSSADPQRTFLDLVGVRHLDIGFTNRVRRLRCDGYVAKLHLALDGIPTFSGLDAPRGRLIMASSAEAIEVAFDAAKYGDLPDAPVMEVVVPSLHDSSAAPSGQHVLSGHVMYVPYRLKGGWNQTARDAMLSRCLDTLARYAPNVRETVLHAELLTPADIETEYGVTGGHWHHTEIAMDQMLMMRPTYEAAQYRTPIGRLFLCGAGCHPGGDLVGAAGHNAAQEILA